MSNELQAYRDGSAMIVRFARPAIRSPLSVSTLVLLHKLIGDIAQDGDVERIVFTGTGDVFASGANLREIAAVVASDAKEYALRGQTLMTAIADLAQRTVAAVNGYCFGGALDLAVACDSRIASPNAVFSHPGVSLGIITGWSGTQRLPRLVGEAYALEMLLTGRRVDAAEAFHRGLVDGIADDPLAAALIV